VRVCAVLCAAQYGLQRGPSPVRVQATAGSDAVRRGPAASDPPCTLAPAVAHAHRALRKGMLMGSQSNGRQVCGMSCVAAGAVHAAGRCVAQQSWSAISIRCSPLMSCALSCSPCDMPRVAHAVQHQGCGAAPSGKPDQTLQCSGACRSHWPASLDCDLHTSVCFVHEHTTCWLPVSKHSCWHSSKLGAKCWCCAHPPACNTHAVQIGWGIQSSDSCWTEQTASGPGQSPQNNQARSCCGSTLRHG
jgi:hypothetical protein